MLYPVASGTKFFEPIIDLPQKDPPVLSFFNLVEAHVLGAIRADYGVSLQRVRKTLKYLERHSPSKHPLAHRTFKTDGLNLFVEFYGQLVNVSKDGQVMMRGILEAYLHRIKWGADDLAGQLFPFTRKRQLEEPMCVVIDPRLGFGRPVLRGTGIPTATIAERYKAGESMAELAEDYGRTPIEIEEAIRCELWVRAA